MAPHQYLFVNADTKTATKKPDRRVVNRQAQRFILARSRIKLPPTTAPTGRRTHQGNVQTGTDDTEDVQTDKEARKPAQMNVMWPTYSIGFLQTTSLRRKSWLSPVLDYFTRECFARLVTQFDKFRHTVQLAGYCYTKVVRTLAIRRWPFVGQPWTHVRRLICWYVVVGQVRCDAIWASLRRDLGVYEHSD